MARSAFSEDFFEQQRSPTTLTVDTWNPTRDRPNAVGQDLIKHHGHLYKHPYRKHSANSVDSLWRGRRVSSTSVNRERKMLRTT